jgi:Ca-activated chloride channel family protein
MASLGCGGVAPKGEPRDVYLRTPAAMEKDKAGGKEKFNTEAYDRIVENSFLDAARHPLSTFSIDVDTASYSNVRRFLLTEGRLPPADAVRIEELVNYFRYDYPRPVGKHPVAFAVDIADCPWNDRHNLVRIGVQGKSLDPSAIPPRNLVFLLDTSGSMQSPDKLELLKKSLRMLVEGLGPRDRVALVAYAGSAGLVLPSTPGDQRERILGALGRLEAGGSTNGGQGIELAYRVAQEHLMPGGLNRVILGTDGDFNVGTTSRGELTRLIERQRETGIYLTVLGFGMGNLKDATMEELARHGNGHYAYIDSLDEAYKVFVEQGGALVTIAQDVKLQVEFNPARVGAYRLIGYENRLLRDEDFNDDRKDAGDLGSGHTVTALYEIVPPGEPVPDPGVDPLKYQKPRQPAAGGSGEWLTVKLRYKDPGRPTSKRLEQPLVGEVGRMEEAPADFRFAAAVAEFGLLLRKSEYRGSASYAQVRDLARGATGGDWHRVGFLELVDRAERLAGAE